MNMNQCAPTEPLSGHQSLDAKQSRSPNQVIRAHTGLRGVAALLVVAYHQQLGGSYKLPFETATGLFRRSYLMVDLFFVLSGFIISYVYNAERDQGFTSGEIKSFLFARFARIYPLHLFALVFLTVVTLGISVFLAYTGYAHVRPSSHEFYDWCLQLLLLNAWISAADAWNVPSWSISAELFAYVLFPIIVIAHMRKPRMTSASLLAIALAFYVYVTAVRSGSLDITVGLAPIRCIAGFGLGMVLYYSRSAAAGASNATLSSVQGIAIFWIVLALMTNVADPLIIPAFAILIGATWTDRGIIARLMSARRFQWLGDISYSVYLMHVPLGTAMWFLWSHVERRLGFSEPVDRVIWLCLIFSIVLGVSTITFQYVEVPARRALVRRLVRRRVPAGEVAVAAP